MTDCGCTIAPFCGCVPSLPPTSPRCVSHECRMIPRAIALEIRSWNARQERAKDAYYGGDTTPDTRKARNQTNTQCRRGHPFTEANTYISADGWRTCRVCKRDADAKSRAKNRNSANA